MKKIFLALTIFIIGCNSKNENLIEASGTIEGTEIKISSKISGTIKEIYFKEGEKISIGDTLIEIDKKILELQHQQSEAGYEIAKAQYELLLKGARFEDVMQVEENLNQAKANYKIANDDFERMTSLYNSSSITKKQFDDFETKYKIAKAQLNSAKQGLNKIKKFARPEELTTARAKVDQSKANSNIILQQLNDATVISPISGIVTELPFDKDELLLQGGTVATIINLDEVYLRIYISEVNLGKINYNNKVEVSIDGIDKIFKGKITYISPTAEFTPKNIQTKEDRAKLVYSIKVLIKNENNILKSGMPADAKIYF